MDDFFRAAAYVPRLKLACPAENADYVLEGLAACEKAGADIAVFPELCLTGYTCADLFFEETLLEGAKESLTRLIRESRGTACAFAVGAPLRIGEGLYNCAVLIRDGTVLGIVPKTFLPDAGEFYEKRWFSPAPALQDAALPEWAPGISKDGWIPAGGGLIFSFGGVGVGIELCEDLWSPIPPSSFLALGGARLILNLSASNETASKSAYRRDLCRGASGRLVCGYLYVSAGSEESTTDLVFSGHAVAAENGTLLGENPPFCGRNMLTADFDFGLLAHDRIKNKTFSDTSHVYGRPVRTVACAPLRGADGTLRNVSKTPFVPDADAARGKRCLEIFEMQAEGLKKRLSVTGARPVVGVSGGLDSTLALLVACEAVRKLKKEPSEVIGIAMPGFGTTGRTHGNAAALMAHLGVFSAEIPIAPACRQHFRDIGHEESVHDLTYENVQARERTQILMDYAGKYGGLVVGTGDMSELALGYCTYNADQMSMYAVNVGVPKTLIREIVSAVAESGRYLGCEEVLSDILATPVSPELLPPDASGALSQKTEEIVGSYTLHDFFLYYTLRYGFSPEKIYHLACIAFSDGSFSSETVLSTMRTFYRRFFSQQYKRSCMPDGVKVGSVAVSPRGDLRMPSDACADAFLAAVDALIDLDEEKEKSKKFKKMQKTS